MYRQGRQHNTPLAPVSTYTSRTGNDGSESPRRSRLLDVVHAHLIANKPSICSSGCLVLAQMSRRGLSLPPLPAHVALQGVASGGFSLLPCLIHNIIILTTPCNIIDIFPIPLRASIDRITNAIYTSPRNV